MRRSSASAPSAEGNPILATWIMLTGAAPALVGAKLLACACGGVLYAAGVHRVLVGLSALYLFAAVVPWLQIFSQLGMSGLRPLFFIFDTSGTSSPSAVARSI